MKKLIEKMVFNQFGKKSESAMKKKIEGEALASCF
jgi:hypothetical protein